MTNLYLMTEEMVNKYSQIKSEIIAARDGMTAEEIEISKAEILKECKINDFDPESSEPQELYIVENGIAKIPVEGMLVNKINFCDAFFGETLTTYRFIRESTLKADNDPSVKKIAYYNNSGGGVVSGVDQTAEIIRATKKPTVSIIYDMSASADYWITSATDEIISVSKTGFIGSIGVAAEIVIRDKQDEGNGIKRITLTNSTSKDKRPNMLTEEGQNILIEEMNAVFDVFVDSILEKRGDKLSRESIEGFAGKVFIASKSLELGLIDSIMTEKESESYILTNKTQNVSVSAGKNNNKEGKIMGLKDLLAANPEENAEYVAEKAAEATRIEEAVKADRERFSKVLTLSGVKIPENIMESAKSGDTVESFAIKELEERNKKVAAVSTEEQDLGTLSKEGQEPKNIEGAEKSKAEKTVDNVLDKMLGKKEGVK